MSLVAMDSFYMKIALDMAKRGAERGEVPVGAVVVQEGKILSVAANEIVGRNHPLFHAEWLAIDRAQRRLGKLRIPNATLYTTLEPCTMCAGAILLARIDRVVIGAMDQKRGCAGSVYQLLDDPAFNHRSQVTTGVREAECSRILSEFFSELRREKKRKRAESAPQDGYHT